MIKKENNPLELIEPQDWKDFKENLEKVDENYKTKIDLRGFDIQKAIKFLSSIEDLDTRKVLISLLLGVEPIKVLTAYKKIQLSDIQKILEQIKNG